MANADIKLLFGVAMGSDAEGDSLKEIREGLQQIVKTINDSKELKVVIGLDNAKIEKDWTAQLQSILNNVGKSLKVDIGGVKLDKGVSSTSIESTLKGTGEAASKSKAEIAGYMAQLKPVLTLTSQVGNAVSKMKLNPLKGNEIKQAQDFLNLYSALKKDLEALKSLATETGTSFDDFIELRDEVIKTNTSVLEQVKAFNAATDAAGKHTRELNRAANVQAKYKAIMSPAGSAINSAQTDISKLYRDPIINTEQVTALGELEDRLSYLTVKYKALTDAKRNAERDSASNAPAERDAILAETKAIQEKINAIKEEIKAQRDAQKEAEKRAKDASNPEIQLKREKERLDTLRKIKASIGDVTDAQRKWTASETGKTSEEYKKLATYLKDLDVLYNKLHQGSITPKDAATELAKINLEFKNTKNTVEAAGEATSTFSAKLKKAFSSLGQWVSVAQVMNAVVRTIRQMIQVSIELDSAMTQLKVVTNNTAKEYQNFLGTMQNVAIQTGSSTRDLIDSATTYARLGYSLEESGSLAKFTTMLQNVGDIDVQSAQDSITAIIKAFDDVGASDIESVMDKLVVTGNNFPISVSQIAEGINNASSALSAAGNTFEESVALLTAANTTIQNASKSSTGLRTIAARLRNTKTELDDLGEEMTTATYEKLVSALTSHSVALRDVNGEFRSTYDIVSDISKVWNDISSTEQAALANAIAGTRQQAVFFSLVEQFGEASGAMAAMADSAGALQSAYDEYMESMQAHINQFKAAFETLSADAIQTGLVNDVIDLGRKLIEILDKLVLFINKLGGLKTVLIGVGSALMITKADSIISKFTNVDNLLASVGKHAKLFTGGVEEIGYAISEYGIKNIGAFSKDLGGLQGALDVVGVSATSAQLAMGEFLLVIAAIAAAVAIFKKVHKSSEELVADYKQKKEQLSELNKEYQTNAERIAELQKLANSGKITLVEQEELTKLREANDLLYKQKLLLEDNEKKAASKANKAIQKDYKNAILPFDVGYLFADEQGNVSNVDTGEAALKIVEEYKSALKELHALGKDATEDELSYAQEQVNIFGEALISLGSKVGGWLDDYAGDDEFSKGMKDILDVITATLHPAEYLTNVLTTLPQGAQNYFDKLATSGGVTAEAVEDAANKYPALKTAMELTGFTAEEVAKHYNALSVETGGLSDDSEKATQSLTTLADALTNLQNAYKLVDTAKTEMSTGDGGLSPETIAALAKEEANFIDYLYVENGAVKLNTDAWIENAQAKSNINITQLKEENIQLEKENEKLLAQIAEINTSLGGMAGIGAASTATSGLTAKIKENTEKIKENQNQISIWQTALNSVGDNTNSIANLSDSISGFTSKLQTIANIQQSVADGFTLPIDKAMEYAAVFPEILNNATATADGQIALDEAVTSKLIEGQQAVVNASIDAEITKLEATKASAQARVDYEQAQIDMAKEVAEDEGALAKDLAIYRINLANDLVQKLIDAGMDEAEAFRLAAMAMSGNADAVNQTVANVSNDISNNMGQAAKSAADAFDRNMEKIKQNAISVGAQIAQTLLAAGITDTNFTSAYVAGHGGGELINTASISTNSGGFQGVDFSYNGKGISLDDYVANLESDISKYQEVIDGLNGQIAALEALKNKPLSAFTNSSGGGGGSSAAKEVEEYTAEIDKYYKALKQLEAVQLRLRDLQSEIDLVDENDPDGNATRIKITKQMLDLYKQQERALTNLNNLRADTIKQNIAKLKELGFEIDYNSRTNEVLVRNMEHLNELQATSVGKYNSLEEATNEYRKETEKLIKTIEDLASSNQDGDKSIQSLKGSIQDAKKAIVEYFEAIVKEANEVVDGIQNVYSTITSAAREYAETGYLSVDNLQSILDLGPKYLDYLMDENGQLVLNEERIQKVLAAKTEQMAAETALSYAKQVLLAAENGEVDTLDRLAKVEPAASNATWDMAYATLALARATGVANGLNADLFDDAASYVMKMQSLTKTTVDSISAYYETLNETYISQKDGLNKILDLTKDMIKWENEQAADALEKQKDDYADIINAKKELIKLAKEQADREKTLADKIAEIAKLQARIDQLALDDSREAQAERRSLEEELAKLQKDLADDQADYSVEMTTEALDKQLKDFEDTKDDEIEKLQNTLSSEEKLYQAAIDRIGQGWDALGRDLMNWNYEYGSTLQSELTNAWDAATEAVKRYGSFVNALSGVQEYTNVGTNSAANNQTYSQASAIANKMRQNSLDWFTADSTTQGNLSRENATLASQYAALIGEPLISKNGSWYLQSEPNSPIYRLGTDEVAKYVVKKMKDNALAWSAASSGDRVKLSKENEELAKRLENFLGVKITKDNAGVWWIGSEKLFDKYHTGGIVGDKASLKQNEALSILEQGEMVLDQQKQNAFYKLVDFASVLSEKLGKAIDSSAIDRVFGGISPIITKTSFGSGMDAAANIKGNFGGDVIIEKVEVTAPIHVVQKLDKEDIREHSRMIGELSTEYIKEGFTKRGIKGTASLF